VAISGKSKPHKLENKGRSASSVYDIIAVGIGGTLSSERER